MKYGGKEQMQMDENNDKMRYTLESEDEMAQPQPMQSEKNVKPMAERRLSQLKASGFQLKR